jgi:hypothetical protein
MTTMRFAIEPAQNPRCASLNFDILRESTPARCVTFHLFATTIEKRGDSPIRPRVILGS